MSRSAQGKLSALGLAVLGLSLLALIWDGRISDFVDPHLAILVFPAGLACVILAQVVLADSRRKEEPEPLPGEGEAQADESGWPGWGVLWIAIPIIIGFLFP